MRRKRGCGPERRLVVGSLLLLALAGCTRVPRPSFDAAWNPLPLSRRSADETPAKPAAPKVAANAGSVPEDDPFLTIAVDEANDEPRDESDSETIAAVARLETIVDEEVTDAVAPASESRVQQLRQALTADAHRTAEPAHDTDAQSPLRMRIDALLRKSSQQRDSGQLAEARSTAQRAVDLADEAQVSFLPTELRPTDLLRQMTDALNRESHTQQVVAPSEETDAAPFLTVISEPAAMRPSRRPRDDLPREFGQVAANRPMRLKRPSTSEVSETAAVLPMIALTTAETRTDEVPTASPVELARREELVKGRDHTGPKLALPERAPDSPSIDPLKPLPKFRSTDRPAKPAELAPLKAIPLPGVGLRGWSLWGPVFGLGAILAVVGLGLLGRQLLIRRAAK